MPVPAIVATDLVAVADRPPVTAPEFPGVSEADTPIFDDLWTTGMSRSAREADAMLAESFEPWGLDELAPLPIESMIKELVEQVGDGTAWAVEQEVGHAILARRFSDDVRLGEEDNDGSTDSQSTGDADLADGPEGPAVVGGDAADGHPTEGAG